jgi:type 1 glutamine amidotransferase
MLTSSRIKTLSVSLLVLACLTAGVLGASPERRVLVYTKNQVGKNQAGKAFYVHDNIPASVAAIKKLGEENNFAVDVSDDPAVFTDQNLKRYKALVFDNTNNEIFGNEEQKAAFQRYIRGFKSIESPKGAEQRVALWGYASSGGGFVGIHSASGSMRQWPWFWEMLGGKFLRHPKLQPFTIKVKDPKDPSTAHLPASFQWTDEFYFLDHMPDGLHVLLAGDLTTLDDPAKEKYPGKKFGDEFPLAWRHQFDGGREWYTALGHKPEYYSDPRLAKHILGGILWAMGEKN